MDHVGLWGAMGYPLVSILVPGRDPVFHPCVLNLSELLPQVTGVVSEPLGSHSVRLLELQSPARNLLDGRCEEAGGFFCSRIEMLSLGTSGMGPAWPGEVLPPPSPTPAIAHCYPPILTHMYTHIWNPYTPKSSPYAPACGTMWAHMPCGTFMVHMGPMFIYLVDSYT